MQFILRRLAFYLMAAWASITLNFFLPRMLPGDPASALFARLAGRMKPEDLEIARRSYGFVDGPLWEQYLIYLSNVLRGDFGISISSFPARVSSIVATGLFWTLLLGGVSLLISYVIGTLLGVYSAWRRGGIVDSFLPPLMIFVGSFPYFWLAMLALFFISFSAGVLPMSHAYETTLIPSFTPEFIGSVLQHLILPAGTIVLVSIGGWMLGMRNTMIGILAEDYITMAEAKGLPQHQIMLRYAARSAMLPNVTAFGLGLGFVISGALLTEIVFSYPGLGFQLIRAVSNLDYPLMQALFLMITLSVLGANLIVDLLYVRLDPRVRVT